MDLSNLEPGVNQKSKEASDKASEFLEETMSENIKLPLVEEKDNSQQIITKDGKQLTATAKIIPSKEVEAEKSAKRKISEIIVDAATRTAAQMRLEACENDITIEAVYNQRLETLMLNENLDEKGVKTAKMVLDSAFKVARKMGVPDRDDTDTIFLLGKTATGEFNPREEMSKAKVEVIQKTRISDDRKKQRRKKNKLARKSRKRNK